MSDRPIPIPDAATATYWSAANEGRLMMPRCSQCCRWHFYPRALCPHCGSDALEWTACSGAGTVYSFTVVHRAPSPAFAQEVPYVVAIVAVEEGPHLMTSVAGCAPDQVHIGMKVRARFRRVADDTQVPVFEPA